MSYRIGAAEPASATDVYAAVGFRHDLVDDLGLVVELGGSVFSATEDSRVVGISSFLPFGATGWVGGVAVLPEHARRGLGRQLTERAVAALRTAGAETVLLHATEMARPLYTRMGFVAAGSFVEMEGPALPGPPGRPSALRPATEADLDEALALDREATGEDRSRLLRALWSGRATVYADPGVVGFHLPQIATGAGAVLAAGPTAPRLLLEQALGGRPGPLRVSFPVTHRETETFLAAAGYAVHNRTTRMFLGPPLEDSHELLVSAFNLYWG